MSRKNSRQKRAAKRRVALAMLANDRNPSVLTTEGHMRSSTGKAKANKAKDALLYRQRLASDRPVEFLDGAGKRGHVVKGKFVPKAHSKRHDGQSRELLDLPHRGKDWEIDQTRPVIKTQVAPVITSDSVRSKYRSTWYEGRPIIERKEGEIRTSKSKKWDLT